MKSKPTLDIKYPRKPLVFNHEWLAKRENDLHLSWQYAHVNFVTRQIPYISIFHFSHFKRVGGSLQYQYATKEVNSGRITRLYGL